MHAAVLDSNLRGGNNLERYVRRNLLLGPPGTVSWRSLRPPAVECVGGNTGGAGVEMFSDPMGGSCGRAKAVGVALACAGGKWGEDTLAVGGGDWVVGGDKAA